MKAGNGRGAAFNEWKKHPICAQVGSTIQQAMTHFDAGWVRASEGKEELADALRAFLEWSESRRPCSRLTFDELVECQQRARALLAKHKSGEQS